MLGARGVIGARPGTHRVRSYTKATKGGTITVRQHTATNALQVSRTVRNPDLKSYMARKASTRSANIRAARLRALAHKY